MGDAFVCYNYKLHYGTNNKSFWISFKCFFSHLLLLWIVVFVKVAALIRPIPINFTQSSFNYSPQYLTPLCFSPDICSRKKMNRAYLRCLNELENIVMRLITVFVLVQASIPCVAAKSSLVLCDFLWTVHPAKALLLSYKYIGKFSILNICIGDKNSVSLLKHTHRRATDHSGCQIYLCSVRSHSQHRSNARSWALNQMCQMTQYQACCLLTLYNH